MTKRNMTHVKTTLAVLASLLFMEASAGTDKEPLVTLKTEPLPLSEILTRLEKETGMTFSYESSLLENMPKANVRFYQTPFSDCMRCLCRLFPIRYERMGKHVILKRKTIRERSSLSDSVPPAGTLPDQFLPEVMVNAPHSDKNQLRSPQTGKTSFDYSEP